MRRLFDMDNPVMKALSVAADLLVLNLLTLLCSLPILTAGAAFTAMSDIVIRLVRQEEGYIVKPFFRSFAGNLKKGSLLGILLLAAAALLYFDYLAALVYIPALRAGIAAIAVIVLAVALYAFPLLARYENTLGGTLKNAATLSVGYFPRTLAMVVCAVGFWVLALRFASFGVPILTMFGLSLPCYVCVLLLNGVFHKLENSDPPENE